MMTLTDLKTIYERSYRTASRELAMRRRVLEGRADYAAKLAELETLLTDLTTLKDELKKRLEAEQAQPEQLALIDVPVRSEFK